MRIERLAGDQPEPRFDLRGVRIRFLQLRSGLRRRDANEERALRHARAALDRASRSRGRRFRR